MEDADFSELGRLRRLRVPAHGMVSAYAPRTADGHACGLCVVACPEQAITLVRHR